MKDSRIPFHVTSLDWQESDACLRRRSSPLSARQPRRCRSEDYGEFDGVMLEDVLATPDRRHVHRRPHARVGRDWGRGTAKLVIENSYAQVSESTLTNGDSRDHTRPGRFRSDTRGRDGGEQINARVKLTRRPMADLRHAFELDDWPVEGFVSGEYHVYGEYETPFGFGTLVIDRGGRLRRNVRPRRPRRSASRGTASG